MKMYDMVSVIIPIYNAKNYLVQCLNSVIAQTYKNIEILLINDGSTDDSLEICNLFSKSDNRIKVINKKNTGVSNTRNIGIKEAKGKYICFIDSDDFIDEEYIGTLYCNITSKTLVMCDVNRFVTTVERKDDKPAILFFNKNQFLELYKKGIINSPWARIYEKKILYKYNIYFDETISLGEDLIFNLEYLKHVDYIKIIKGIYYYYRLGNLNSLSRKYFDNMMEIQLKLYDKFCSFFVDEKMAKISGEKIKFITTIISNEFHNYSVNPLKRYANARKIMDNAIIRNKILSERQYMNKFDFFLLRNRLYLLYKLCKRGS